MEEIWLSRLVVAIRRLSQPRLRRHSLAAKGIARERHMAKYELTNDGVVVIVGSGAGGGTLANELCQKGVQVVLLEAGQRVEIKDFVNDEWPMFNKIAWLDKRTTSGSWRVAKNFPNL